MALALLLPVAWVLYFFAYAWPILRLPGDPNDRATFVARFALLRRLPFPDLPWLGSLHDGVLLVGLLIPVYRVSHAWSRDWHLSSREQLVLAGLTTRDLIVARTGTWLMPMVALVFIAMYSFLAVYLWVWSHAPVASCIGFVLFDWDPSARDAITPVVVVAAWSLNVLYMLGVGTMVVVSASLASVCRFSAMAASCMAVGLGCVTVWTFRFVECHWPWHAGTGIGAGAVWPDACLQYSAAAVVVWSFALLLFWRLWRAVEARY